MTVRRTIIAASLLAVATAAQAGEVKLLTDSQQAWVGVPLTVAVDVTFERSHSDPVFPDLPNCEVQAGGQQTNSQTTIINGAIQQRQTLRYLYQVVPNTTGVILLPAIDVTVDGQKLQTRSRKIRVLQPDNGNRLYIEVLASKDSVYVGEPVDLTLEIWLEAYQQSRVTLDERQMWSTISKDGSSWGPFEELITGRRPDVKWREDTRQGDDGRDRSYYVYELHKRITPDRAGPLKLNDVRIMVQYPLGVSRDRFAFFNDLQITSARPIAATVEKSPVTVKPIPTAGRPPYYNGAVGPHKLMVTAAPTKVRVGDPITLNITASGDGSLDLLQAPRLSELPQFLDKFQVSDDRLPGIVQGSRKLFTQSVRALSDDVTEIPAIPFAYFDTDSEQFVTVYSNPIPLEVSAAEKMSVTQIVESAGNERSSVDHLTHLTGGIEGNYVRAEDLLANQSFHPTVTTAGAAALPPLVYLACITLVRVRRRRAADVALTRRRSAKRHALSQIRGIRPADDEAARFAGLAAALLGYVADRLNLPAAGLTRGEAADRLRQAGTADDMVETVDDLLAECEAMQFGGGLVTSGRNIEERVVNAIDKLEALKF